MLPLGDCRDGCLMQIFQTANAVGTHREAVFRTGWVSVPFGIVPPIGGGSIHRTGRRWLARQSPGEVSMLGLSPIRFHRMMPARHHSKIPLN